MQQAGAFTDKVKQWTQLYSEKQALQEKMRDLNVKLKPLKESILQEMEQRQIPGVSCGGYKIVFRETFRNPAISRKRIEACDYFPNKESMEKFMQSIQKEGPKRVCSLKVTKED